MESNTPIIAFDTLFDLIMALPENPEEWSAERLGNHIKRIKETGKETYDKFQTLSEEFTALRERNLELEDAVKLLHDNLDQQRASMSQGDVESHREACKDLYRSFWDKLDRNSQEFFITAHYLYEKSSAQQTDFSPVIIEFCRIFENELLVEIFDEFIRRQASLNRPMSYNVRLFGKVENAINSQSTTGSYFLSSMDMLKLLSYMNRRFNDPGYEKELQEHIKRKGFDVNKVSDRTGFIEPGKIYVNDYRNEAAHPNYLDEVMATDCKSETEVLVGTFLSAKR